MTMLHEKTGRTESLPVYYARRVSSKLASGEYPQEDVACFCGSRDSKPVTQRDRYNIPYQMNLCRVCGILYANPRMTRTAYRKFYETEYRKIYDNPDESAEQAFKSSLIAGSDFKAFLDYFEIKPKSVFDIGCNTGAWLVPFMEDGADVLGVDYGESVGLGQEHHIPVIQGGIEEIERTGRQADLIILNHVLEHFLDLEQELTRIWDLLSDSGHLFIGVPGLFTWHRDVIFQNAHTYQFTPETLTYVMECCGFEEVYCDSHITSIWKKAPYRRMKTEVSHEAIRSIHNYLFEESRLVPKIRTINKFDMTLRKDHIQAALKSGYPDMAEWTDRFMDQSAVIIGGGPSVNDQLEAIFALKNKGHKILIIERMYEWALANGLTPDFVVGMDASDDVIENFNRLHQDVVHFLALQCPPTVWERLRGHKVYLFNTPQRGIDLMGYWDEHKVETATLVNSGGSVTICAMAMAMALGCRDLHIFGFDCHINTGNYAKGITGVGEIKDILEVTVDGKLYTTTAPYLSFAQEFIKFMNFSKKKNMVKTYKIYGDSLASAISKEDIKGHVI